MSDTSSHDTDGIPNEGETKIVCINFRRKTLPFPSALQVKSAGLAALVGSPPLCGGAIAFITSIAAQWLIYDYWLKGRGLRLADPSVAAVAVALFVRHLRQTTLRNRLADLRRFTVIREMNHHIRNALQVLAYQLSCQINHQKWPNKPSKELNGF